MSQQVSQARLPNNGIFIKNASFEPEQSPAFTAATTTRSVFVNGQAAGSAADDQYGWALGGAADAVSAQFDTSKANFGTGSFKLSNTNATGRARGLLIPAANYGTIAAAHEKYLIPCKANTTYTLTCYAQCTNAPTNGVSIGLGGVTGAGGTASLTLSNRLSGTVSTWTLLTVSVTTGASDKFLCIQLNNDTAGNVCDAWFDDLLLLESGVVRS